jgi:hypothetical protein
MPDKFLSLGISLLDQGSSSPESDGIRRKLQTLADDRNAYDFQRAESNGLGYVKKGVGTP